MARTIDENANSFFQSFCNTEAAERQIEPLRIGNLLLRLRLIFVFGFVPSFTGFFAGFAQLAPRFLGALASLLGDFIRSLSRLMRRGIGALLILVRAGA